MNHSVLVKGTHGSSRMRDFPTWMTMWRPVREANSIIYIYKDFDKYKDLCYEEIITDFFVYLIVHNSDINIIK